MKIFIYSLFVFIIISCEKVDLLPITSEDLIEKVATFKDEKAVLVNVWALYCKPCIEEFPMLIDLRKKFYDLEVILINVDFEEEFEEVKNFLKKQNLDSVSYIKRQNDEEFINGLNPNWSGSIPFTVIYAKKTGVVIDYWEGKKSFSKFKSSIELAINSEI